MTLVGLLAVDLLSMLLLGLLVVPISILTLAVDEAGAGTDAPRGHGNYRVAGGAAGTSGANME